MEMEAHMPERTWSAAFREVLRSAARHKVGTGVFVACVAASLAAIGWAGTSSSASAGPDKAAPAFSLPVLGHSAQRVSLSSYAGRPLIVNFFASWCSPCQGETPLLAKFYRAEHGKVALLGLDENDVVANALTFTRADGVTYPVGWDPEVVAGSAYGVTGLPQTFFLNAQHQIVDRVYGAVTTAELTKGIALATAASG
jgi:cytochrome c biogenesis protein CcmG, thiol:disulfide interchange protein DsbE